MHYVDKYLPTYIENFKYWFNNDKNVVDFCSKIVHVIHLWDDLIDKDKPTEDEDINEAFTSLMVDIPLNPFYIANINFIAPMLQSIISKWHTANVFERDKGEGDVEKAYMLRAEMYQLFVLCAELIGGREWSRFVAPNIWRLYGEKLEVFKKEVQDA